MVLHDPPVQTLKLKPTGEFAADNRVSLSNGSFTFYFFRILSCQQLDFATLEEEF
jgi:hypothetical protein